MKRKRILIIITIICLLIAVGIGVGAWFVKNKKEVISEKNVKHEECDFTRYEWMEILCEKVGITDYESNTSYFEDVATDNKYFSYVQAAVEWEVLDDDDQFYGDYCASGEFIAMTSIKTVSKEKIGVYLNYDEEITDEKYLEIALELKLISEEELNKCFSLIDAQMVIERLEGLCFGIFWEEDYEKIKLAENVSEILKEEVLEINNDGSEIVVSQNTLEELKIGQTVIFDYGNTGLKCAREVIGIEKDGTISLGEDVKLEDAFEEIIISDVKELTFEDIANYYGVDVQEADGFVNTKIYDKEINSKGFKINLEINDENELSIKITDNKSGCWFDLPVDIALEKGVECEVELDIDKINVGAQVNYEVIRGLKSADVALESHANISGDIQGFSVEKRITLYETVTPIGTGYVGVDIGVYLVLSAEGTIHFETEIPMDAAVNYEKGKGIKKHSFNMDVENPLIEGDCTAGISVQFEPTLVILMIIDVVDVQTDVGIGAHANVKIRPGSQTCTDISVFYPTFKVAICGDDESDTLLALLGVSVEWEIITEDNAPCKLHLHHEILANGKMQFVDECTYEEDGEEETTEEETVVETESQTEKVTEDEKEIPTNSGIVIEEELINLSKSYGQKYIVEFFPKVLEQKRTLDGDREIIENIYVVATGSEYELCGVIRLFEGILWNPNELSVGSEVESMSGNRYTVVSVSKSHMQLKNSQGKVFHVDPGLTEEEGDEYVSFAGDGAVETYEGKFVFPYGSVFDEWLIEAAVDGVEDNAWNTPGFKLIYDENGNIYDYKRFSYIDWDRIE